MTIEEKKEWLGSYSRIVREIEVLCEEHERVFAMIHKFNNMDKIGLQESVDKMQEIVAHIDARVAALVPKRKAIKAAIDSVTDEKYRELLYLRYIMGMTHEEIARKVDIDTRWVFRLFNKALAEINIPQEG